LAQPQGQGADSQRSFIEYFMGALHLEVVSTERDGRSRRISRLTSASTGKTIEVFYELDRSVPLDPAAPLDGFVLPFLLYAAARKVPLVVHGAMSRSAVRNFSELLLIWHRWRRERYGIIEIVPERIIDDRPKVSNCRALGAFSGGVDATFMALSRDGRCGNSRKGYDLDSVLMVHGFDVEPYNFGAFAELVDRVRPLLENLGLELRTVRTNSRDLKLQDWDDSFGLELAACLHLYSREFGFGLIASGESYDILQMPWGSGPVTDHLMSGDLLQILHVDAGFSRTQKVAAIAQNVLATQTLKVCWAGAEQGQNCGRCEKCVRTRLNFLATGEQETPACFPNALDLDLIGQVPIENRTQRTEMASICDYAMQKNISAPWLDILTERVRAWEPLPAEEIDRKKKGSAVKRAAVKLATTLGIAVPAKKVWRPVRRAVLRATNRTGAVDKW